jgi:hypothetical protein
VNVQLGYLLSGVVTLALLWSLGRLIAAVFAHGESPGDLLRSGALLWVANVLVSASWYWRLDAGGPHGRAQRLGHPTGAFLFPQMVMAEPRGGDVIERRRGGRPVVAELRRLPVPRVQHLVRLLTDRHAPSRVGRKWE